MFIKLVPALLPYEADVDALHALGLGARLVGFRGEALPYVSASKTLRQIRVRKN